MDPYQYKLRQKSKIAVYNTRFSKLKTELLSLRWDIDQNIDDGPMTKNIKSKLSKIAKILFDIEHDFSKIK